MNLARFGDKVVFFSDTSGGGWRGGLRRVRNALDKGPAGVRNDLRRKLHRRLHPHETMPFAQAIHIEVTNACNLQCVMCPRTGMDRHVGFMDRKLFEKIVAELRPYRHYIESVALMGLGEPFLHKELIDFARHAKAAGLGRIYTSTNSTQFTEDLVDEVLDAAVFDQLILSIDGGKETYEKVRPGEPYETVESGVQRLLRAKRKRGLRRPEIELQILYMDETASELEAFCERWVPELGLSDRILIKEVDTFGGQVSDRRLTGQKRREPADRYACRQLWKDMSIGWDGLVTVCCKDVLYKLAVGNAGDQRLIDLWHGKRWEGIRRLHTEGKWDWLDPCNVCREWWI
ncbi:MAG: radical SAM protein [Candidatus Lernaella stagnicola]|nr:radical SAM protein [Candidatus Lernaella stagnicola]